MIALDSTTAETRFNSFNVYRTSYKIINNHKIDVGILVPKDLDANTKHPIAVKFHGGGLVNGDCLYADWISAWWIPFLNRNSAITVLPNYRLTPEASGNNILTDLSDFWIWFRNGGVDTYLASQNASVELDYNRILVSGESAGGYMALQSGLTQPKGDIRCILAQYPMTNFPRRSPTDVIMGYVSPPETALDEVLAKMKPDDVVSSSNPSTEQRGILSLMLNAYNRYNEFFGTGKHLWPITAVEQTKYLPPTTIIHSGEDTAVPLADSKVFVDKIRRLVEEGKFEVEGGFENLRLAEVEKGEHGFDVALKESEEEWLREELAWVERLWLA